MTDLRTTSPTFVIDSLSKDDEGTYSCLATNQAGQVEERLQVMVTDSPERQSTWSQTVQDPSQLPSPTSYQEPRQREHFPKPRTNYPPPIGYQFEFEDYDQEDEEERNVGLVEHEVNTREGLNVNLTCMSIGTVTSNTVWSRADGRPINPRHDVDNGIIHITGVTKDDEGVYVCESIRDGKVIFQLNANLVVKGIETFVLH